jgi:hypothetical protein
VIPTCSRVHQNGFAMRYVASIPGIELEFEKYIDVFKERKDDTGTRMGTFDPGVGDTRSSVLKKIFQ